MTLDTKILRDVGTLLKNNITEKTVDHLSPLAIVVRGMEIMDSYKQLDGRQKKDYVLAVVKELSKEANGVPAVTLNALEVILNENILGSFINIVSDATKGKVDINNVVATTTSCLGICFGRNFQK